MRQRYYSLIIDGKHFDHPLGVLRQRRALQLCVYRFLEKPRGILAQLYQFTVFALIIFVYILGIVGSECSDFDILSLILWLELFLTLYLFAEFLARFWAVGADAKYRSLRGRVAYLCRPICLIDLVVLCAGIFLLITTNGKERIDGGETLRAMATNGTWPLSADARVPMATSAKMAIDRLRFVQILRLLHIDRQMSAWALVNKMMQRCRFELLAAYYIALMIFLTLAVSVYTADAGDDPSAKTFQNFGDSFWFSIVTVLTIGYGDIVPRGWLSKLAVCLFSYLGLSMFSAASGLVGVGMSLMLSSEKQQRQQRKLRDLAARLIQSWFRHWLVTERDQRYFYRFRVFRRHCARLRRAEERIRRTRMAVEQAAKKKREGKQTAGGLLTRVLRKRTAEKREQQQHQMLLNNLTFSSLSSFVSLRKVSMDLAETWPRIQERTEAESEEEGEQDQIMTEEEEEYEEDNSTSSSKCENIEQNCGEDDGAVTGDDFRCGRYRAMLAMCYFFTFITLRKKFRRARDPCELANAEQELCEMEHQRGQKLKELESRLEKILDAGGKAGGMALGERMDWWEARMAELERKGTEMERMAEAVLGEMMMVMSRGGKDGGGQPTEEESDQQPMIGMVREGTHAPNA